MQIWKSSEERSSANLLLPIKKLTLTVIKQQRWNSNTGQDDMWLFKDLGNFSPNILDTLLICWLGKFHQERWSSLFGTTVNSLWILPLLWRFPSNLAASSVPVLQKSFHTDGSQQVDCLPLGECGSWKFSASAHAQVQSKCTLRFYDTPGRQRTISTKKVKQAEVFLNLQQDSTSMHNTD